MLQLLLYVIVKDVKHLIFAPMYSKLFHNNVHSRKLMMEHLQIITLQTRCCCYITTDEPIMFSLFIFTFSRNIYEWGRTCKIFYSLVKIFCSFLENILLFIIVLLLGFSLF